MWLMCGGYVSVDYVIETVEHAIPHGENYARLKRKFTPPLMPDYGDPGWFQSFELGHQGYSEFLVYWDPDENTDKVDEFYLETSKENIRKHFYTSMSSIWKHLRKTSGSTFIPRSWVRTSLSI
jgi:hypothetical protein